MEQRDEISAIRDALGRRVHDLRIEQGLTQERLGLMVGLDRTYIIGIEKGRRNISIDNLVKLSRGLGVSLSELLAGVDPDAESRSKASGGGSFFRYEIGL